MAASTRRFVQVMVIDPHPSVPLDQCVLFRGEPKMTDFDDNELYFELDIRGLLEKHNVTRVKLRDKAMKDREQMLEPARVRDLRMCVVTIATF